MEESFSQLYLEHQLCFPLYAASRLTTKMYAPYLEELGLTYPQYLVMLVLWEHKTQSVGEIGQRLLLESNTLTPLLKRLEQKQLIYRKRSEKDERTVLISLTDQGWKLREKAWLIPQRIFASFQSETLSEMEIAHLQQTLFKLLGILKIRGNLPDGAQDTR